MSGTFKVGDLVTYLGPSQAGILAPLDLVEVVSYNPISNQYQLKIPHNNVYRFFAPACDLRAHQASLPWNNIDSYGEDSYTDSSYSTEKRKEAGECVRCGTKREMSIHGLLDCKFCGPS